MRPRTQESGAKPVWPRSAGEARFRRPAADDPTRAAPDGFGARARGAAATRAMSRCDRARSTAPAGKCGARGRFAEVRMQRAQGAARHEPFVDVASQKRGRPRHGRSRDERRACSARSAGRKPRCVATTRSGVPPAIDVASMAPRGSRPGRLRSIDSRFRHRPSRQQSIAERAVVARERALREAWKPVVGAGSRACPRGVEFELLQRDDVCIQFVDHFARCVADRNDGRRRCRCGVICRDDDRLMRSRNACARGVRARRRRARRLRAARLWSAMDGGSRQPRDR